MKKTRITISVVAILCMTIPMIVSAQSTQFTVSLGYGSPNTAAVTELQNFLIAHGYLHVAATGNYLGLTEAAVAAFQTAHDIASTGYFGPLSRAAANAYLSVATASPASISNVAIHNTENSLVAAVLFSNQKTITWNTSGYPSNAGVDINLIRKTSDSPVTFTLVRTITSNIANSGQYVWSPQSGDIAPGLYVQVVCSTSSTFTGGCSLNSAPVPVQ